MDPEKVGRDDPVSSPPALAFLAAAGLAVASLAAAAAAGPPYLELDALNGWIVVFAAAAFAALFSVPFAANRVLTALRPEKAESWEPAMLAWGAVALLAALAGWALIAAGGYSPGSSLGDAVGLVIVIEASLVLLTLAGWMLAG